jgi:hypothetical protein
MFDHGSLVTHLDADSLSVRSINLALASNADRFVIGRDESLVRNLVVTTKLAETEPKVRFSVE